MIEMKGTILLNHYENTRQVEDEEKSRFLRGLLEQTFEGTPNVVAQIAEIWGNDSVLSPAQKVKMREIMNTYHIQVIDNSDGHLKVFADGEIIGEFFKPTYKLKSDPGQLDRKKQLYMEMCVECWSVFEESNDT
jgi:hypothetical protein